MGYKNYFPKMGTKFHQLGKKKKGGLSSEKWQEKRQKTIKENPLW